MAPSGSESSLLLGQVAELPLERRCAFIRRAGESDLDTTMRRLLQDNPDAHRAMSAERLAWAVAFNVTGSTQGDTKPAPRGKRAYLDYWSADTPWAAVWWALASPLSEGDAASTGLLELCASVACEHRDDWQPPGARPVNTDWAQRAFTRLYERHNKKVAGYVSGQFRRRAGDPQEIAIEAWSRVFLQYWSADAHKRVLGTSAISSLVCGTAYYVGCDVLRRERASLAEHARVGVGLVMAEPVGIDPRDKGPGDQMMAAELERYAKQCRETLPARQQIAARLVWDYELKQADVARKLGVSAPAISQLLEKARKMMHKCLKGKGLVATDGVATPVRRAPGRAT